MQSLANQQQQQQSQHHQQQQQQHQQQQRPGGKEPVLLQGDFRKVSGISSEIFRQIEAVENDHDPNTAAALEVSVCGVLSSSTLSNGCFRFAGGGKKR